MSGFITIAQLALHLNHFRAPSDVNGFFPIIVRCWVWVFSKRWGYSWLAPLQNHSFMKVSSTRWNITDGILRNSKEYWGIFFTVTNIPSDPHSIQDLGYLTVYHSVHSISSNLNKFRQQMAAIEIEMFDCRLIYAHHLVWILIKHRTECFDRWGYCRCPLQWKNGQS